MRRVYCHLMCLGVINSLGKLRIIVVNKSLSNVDTAGGHIVLEDRSLHKLLRCLQAGFTVERYEQSRYASSRLLNIEPADVVVTDNSNKILCTGITWKHTLNR